MSKELGNKDDGQLSAEQYGNGMGGTAQELPPSSEGVQADSKNRQRQTPFRCYGRCDPSEMSALHDCFLAGNTDGNDDVIRGLLHWQINLLTERYRDADRALIVDAVNDAFIFYWRDPQTYHAIHGVPLNSYLLLAARRNVLDSLRSATVPGRSNVPTPARSRINLAHPHAPRHCARGRAHPRTGRGLQAGFRPLHRARSAGAALQDRLDLGE